MALTATTANAIVAAPGLTARYVTLASATGATVGMFLKVDTEFMKILDITLSPTLGVNRGDQATVAVAHNAGALAIYGNAADFQNPINVLSIANDPGSNIVTYNANPTGTQTLPVVDSVVLLSKATALAATFALPTLDQTNEIMFTSSTAAAHVLTCTSGWNDGATGATHTTATFAAFKGAGFTAVALNGLWQVQANIAVTFS